MKPKTEMPGTGYRGLLYERYAEITPGMPPSLSRDELVKQGRQLRYHLRGWLPGRKDASIFEIGSGYGRLLELLKDEGYTNTIGTDVSDDQVRAAQELGLQVQLGDGISFLESKAQELDLVVALDVIEHMTKDEVVAFFRSTSQALRAGGRIILQTPNAGSPWGMSLRYGDFTHETGFTPEVLGGLLALFGFSDVEFREVGPIPFGYSITSTVRALLWAVLRSSLRIFNYIEAGYAGPAVLTRSMLVTAKRC